MPVRLQRDFGVIAAAPESQLQFALELAESMGRARRSMRVQLRGSGRRPAGRAQSLAAATPRRPSSPALPRPHWRALLQARPDARAIDRRTAPAFARGRTHARRGDLESPIALRISRLCGDAPAVRTPRAAGAGIQRSRARRIDTSRARAHLVGAARLERLLSLSAGRAGANCWMMGASARARESMPRPRSRPALAAAGTRAHGGVLRKWLEVERQREPFEVEQLEHGSASGAPCGSRVRGAGSIAWIGSPTARAS